MTNATWEITIDYTPANAPAAWEATGSHEGILLAWAAPTASELLAAIARDIEPDER